MTARMIRYDEKYASQIDELVSNSNGHIEIINDPNLEYDPYFYERKKELKQIRDNIKNGNSKLMSFEDFEKNTNKFEKELELKYAN